MSNPVDDPGMLEAYVSATDYRGRWFLVFRLASGGFAFMDDHFLWFLSPLSGSDPFLTAEAARDEARRLIDLLVSAAD